MAYTTLADLYLQPFAVYSILDVSIEARYNQHAHMTVTALVTDEIPESYVDNTNRNILLQLMKINKETDPATGEKLQDIPLFSGTIQDVEVKSQNHQYILQFEVMSCTSKYTYDIPAAF